MNWEKWVSVRSAIFGLLILFVVWIASTYFVRLRAVGYMDSAIGSVKTLVSNEANFAKAHPSFGYSCNLADITSDAALISGHKDEYAFEVSDCRPHSAGEPNASYYVTARPLHADMPAYCSDQSGILKADYRGSTAACVKAGQPL